MSKAAVANIPLALTIFLLSAYGVPAQDECQCQSELIRDIIERGEWPGTHFLWSLDVQDDDQCLLQARLLRNIFKQHKWATILEYSEAQLNQTVSLLNQRNYFIVHYSSLAKELLQRLSDASMLKETSWAVLLRNQEQLKDLRREASNWTLYIDSDFTAYQMTSLCQRKVVGLYRVGPAVSATRKEEGGFWSIEGGFESAFINSDRLLRRSNFHGYPMKGIGVRVFPHFTTYTPDGGITGFVGDLINILRKAHNFTLTYRVLDGYAYGKVIGDKKENKWTGMVGELQNRNVDFTVSELSITRERSDIVSYTQPIYMISRKLYVASREDTTQKFLTYTKPMDRHLYFSTVGVLGCLVICMVYGSRMQRRMVSSKKDLDDIKLGTATWFMISAVLQQGSPTYPNGIGNRMIFWYGFILSFVVFTGYSATLVAQLAVVLPVPLPFTDFYGLVKQSNWDAGNVKNDLFEVTASQTCAGEVLKEECRILQELWQKVVLRSPGNLVTTYIEGLRRSMQRNYVFIGVDVTTINYIKELPREEACTIRELPPKYITGGIAIGMQHQSPFLSSFDDSLQKLKEMGVMEKLVRKWLRVDTSCRNNEVDAMDIIDLGSLFIFLLIGIGTSLLIVLIESVVSRRLNLKVDSTDSIRKFSKEY